MTFEARDSAAKVVPARNKYGGAVGRVGSGAAPFQASRAHSSVRSGGSGQQQAAAAVAAALRAGSPCPSETRRALTAQFVQFSRALQHGSVGGPGSTPISKSPSAPNLAENSPNLSPMTSGFHHTPGGCALLSPHALLYRQALSVDNPDYAGYFSPPRVSESGAAAAVPNQGAQRGSQASMVMDLHVDCPVTLRVKDKTRRSDTAKRHVFTRQNQVEDEETGAHYWERRETHSCSPRLPGYHPARGYEDILQTRSTPHSRRESVAGASRRGSVAETAGSGDCLVRAASLRRPRRLSTESRRRLSMYSRLVK
ncbi:hypothetical protein AAG570_013652 [Ranatra chinensis]|uniref:Uncharacterized protein n=1 Tax=Ranatra chinensis TaxID=642074 RepID=A0ABD0YCT8_9HEMI